jgi:ABC-type antimicrobial peptide transport system permease subunit
MQDFFLWFQTGLEHILDIEGYDHICYVVALAIMYHLQDWKALLIQITAFTVGHSLSLAASVFNVVNIPQHIIEILIPITIIITCVVNILAIAKQQSAQRLNYGLALFFGLIHGLGFSYLLKAMLGKSESVAQPLFAFNLGLEIGQLLIVALALGLTFILQKFKIFPLLRWQQLVSGLVLLIALQLLIGRI